MRRGHGGASPSPAATQNQGFVSLARRTILLCHKADMSAVSHIRHLLCDTADMSSLSHSRHVCCVTRQTCLMCHTADMSAVSQPADMSAVSHGRHVCYSTQQKLPNKVISLCVSFREQPRDSVLLRMMCCTSHTCANASSMHPGQTPPPSPRSSI